MRYRIKKKLSRYLVVDRDGKPLGTHGSAEGARLHLAALRSRGKAPTTAAGRRALDDASFVLRQERKFPITSPQDVKDAVSSWGRYRGPTPFETFKRNLIDLATRKGFASALPASWGVTTKGLPVAIPGGNYASGPGGLFANPALGGGKKRKRLKAGRFAHIDFTPPDGVREAARRGLELRQQHGRGGTAVGVARARDLSNGTRISPSTAKRMHSYFSRHAVDKQGQGFDVGEDGYPSAGRVAWLLWGGDAGAAWARKLVEQMRAATAKVTTTKPAGKYRSIQNPRAYRALRREGYSKEAAARISNAQAPGHTVKAPNYNAKRGEVFAGNLVRGDDGKFSSAGGGGGGDKDAAPKKKRGDAAKKPSREEKRQANIDATFGQQSALEEDEYYDLIDAANGKRDLDTADKLIAKGLMERGDDGTVRLTPSGRVAANAAARGDAGGFADAASRAAERRQRATARDTARQQREQQRNERRAAAEARRAEREAKRQAAQARREEPKKGGGGGGGGKKGDDSAARESSLDRSIDALRSLASAFGRGKTFTVFKDARGDYRWLARTTTAFEDRDGEVLSRAALAADVARADADGRYGPLRWWHIGTPDPTTPDAPWGPGMDLGWCDFNAMSGKTLIESGPFINDTIARWAARNADALGLSPGFFHPATEPDGDGVFHHIRRFERSLAPKARVSNPFTALHITTTTTRKEHASVDVEKIKTLLDLGLDSATIKQLMDGVTATEKTAVADGVRFKTEAPAAADELTINGVTYVVKAAAPAAMPEDETDAEAKADGDDTQLEAALDEADDDAEDAAETMSDLFDMDLPTFRQELRAAFAEAMAPVLAQLKMSEKMEGMLKGMSEEMKAFYGGTTKKETAVATEIAALKARIAELEGDATALQRGHRASAAEGSVTEKAAALAEASQPKPLTGVEDILAWTKQTIPQVMAAGTALT